MNAEQIRRRDSWRVFRQLLPRTFGESDEPIRAASGFDEGVRAIYAVVTVPGGTSPTAGWATLRVSATRHRAPYVREVSLAVGEVLVIEASAMEDTSIDVLACGIAGATLIVSQSAEPPDASRRTVYVRRQAISDPGSNDVLRVPSGSLSVFPLDSFPSWEWVYYGADNTLDVGAQALVAGTEVAVSSSLFRPGASATGAVAWKIEV